MPNSFPCGSTLPQPSVARIFLASRRSRGGISPPPPASHSTTPGEFHFPSGQGSSSSTTSIISSAKQRTQGKNTRDEQIHLVIEKKKKKKRSNHGPHSVRGRGLSHTPPSTSSLTVILHTRTYTRPLSASLAFPLSPHLNCYISSSSPAPTVSTRDRPTGRLLAL